MRTFLKENWIKILLSFLLLIGLSFSFYVHNENKKIRTKEILDRMLSNDPSVWILDKDGQVVGIQEEKKSWDSFWGTFGL